MANIIKPGNRPKYFKEIEVAVTLPDGTEGVIPVTYKYMTKKQFGAWQDGIIKNRPEFGQCDELSWEKLYEQGSELSADRLLDIVHSWGLDVPLSKESVIELEEDCGAAVIRELFKAFGVACREGRLGN